MSDDEPRDILRRDIAPASSERRALVQYCDARIARLHREIEQPRDEETTNRIRGQIVEIRMLARALDA